MGIYLDHAATTPLRSEALEAMLPYLSDALGQSLEHPRLGPPGTPGARRGARDGRGRHRRRPREIVFTSGGTEADNLAISGYAWAASARGRHVITTSIEHKAVLQACALLERHGFEVTYLPVDADGLVDPDAVARGHHAAHPAGERHGGQQ